MILPPNWSLPEAAKRRVGSTTFGKQRSIYEEGHLLLLLHRPPGKNDANREGVVFWRNPDGEWQSGKGGPGKGALKKHWADYAALETKLTENYEADPDSATLFGLLETLSPLTRAVRNGHAALQAAREAVGSDPFLIEMRDAASEVERNFDLLLEDVRNAISYRGLREAEENARQGREVARAGHRLNVLAALFLPLTAVTSIFGMNLRSGLESGSSNLFWAVLLGGVALGGLLTAWILARPKSR